MNFDTKSIGWKHDKLFGGLYDLWCESSASESDNAAFRCDDEDNTKEEEVYQDLCAIQSSIARNRDQVFIEFAVILFLSLICIPNDLHNPPFWR